MEAIGINPLMAVTLNYFNVVIYKLPKKGYINDKYIFLFTIYQRIKKALNLP